MIEFLNAPFHRYVAWTNNVCQPKIFIFPVDYCLVIKVKMVKLQIGHLENLIRHDNR